MENEHVNPLPAFAPAHPGAILREDIFPDLGMTLVALARHLDLSRETLYKIMKEKRAVTADVAVRLGKAFGTASAFWLNMQSQHDAWHAERSDTMPEIKRISITTSSGRQRERKAA